jgi:hypothetical protein
MVTQDLIGRFGPLLVRDKIHNPHHVSFSHKSAPECTADQGLLYHWCKYVQKNVTIVFPHHIENYGELANGTVVLESSIHHAFLNSSVAGGGINNTDYPHIRCLNSHDAKSCIGGAPYSNFVHFTGRQKPWFRPPPNGWSPDDKIESTSAPRLWYSVLYRLNERLSMGLNFSHWETGKIRRPLLGMSPMYGEILTMNTSILDEMTDGTPN